MATVTVTKRIAQASGIVMTSIMVSRALGFLREWTVAHQVGSNAITDAYYAAFTLPDFLNYLVAGGFLSLTFIPVFSQYSAENRESEGWHVFSTVITVMGLLLGMLVVLGEIFAPKLVTAIAPGFPPPEKARAVFLTRLMLPAQICFYLGGILSAVQYAKTRFVIPSLAPVIYNLGVILGGVLLSPYLGITGFAVGVLAGATIGNFALQVAGARAAGAVFRPNFDVRHPGFRLFLKLTIPIMLALSLTVTDDWIIRWFGSYLEPASITWLTYAKALMRVPLGVVGQAVGVASFPFMAQLYSEGKLEELNHTLNTTQKAVILLLLPISVLTILESKPIVYLVFSHTRLRGPDLAATASTLALFSIGLVAWGAQNIEVRAFYAAKDTLTPAIVGTVFTFLSLPLYWLLARWAQHLGLALASSLAILAYTVVLFALLNRRTANRQAGELHVFLAKITLASLLAGIPCFYLLRWLEGRIAWQSAHGALLVLIIVSAVGFLLTGIVAKLLRVRELEAYARKLL